jgi:hypothetical protein
MGCCLLAFRRFGLTVETIATKFMLVHLFPAVSTSDFESAYSTSAFFQWLLLVPSESSCRFTLICVHFASISALCGPMKRSGHLFDQFPTFCNYFRTILICFGSVVGESTLFSFL